jgi:DNA-binding MarR family transcriptional regulator
VDSEEVCPLAEETAAPAGGDVDPLRRMVEDTAAFAHTYLRWIDAQTAEGLTLPRLLLVERRDCKGPAMMRTLADELGLSPRNMTALVDSLESEGLVRRRPHPTDRRATMVELTEDGTSAACETVLIPQMGAMSCLFTDLEPEEQEQFSAALATLQKGMKRRSEAARPAAAG